MVLCNFQTEIRAVYGFHYGKESWQTGKPTVLLYHLRKYTSLSVEAFEVPLEKVVQLAFALVPAEFHASYTHLHFL